MLHWQATDRYGHPHFFECCVHNVDGSRILQTLVGQVTQLFSLRCSLFAFIVYAVPGHGLYLPDPPPTVSCAEIERCPHGNISFRGSYHRRELHMIAGTPLTCLMPESWVSLSSSHAQIKWQDGQVRGSCGDFAARLFSMFHSQVIT
jgi:hypothetical protein